MEATPSWQRIPRFSLDDLLVDWRTSGGKLFRVVSGVCVMESCRSLAFVGLRTLDGPRPVCFQHYETLDGLELPPEAGA